ncbi:MAG: hypothetical protein JW809_11255 [Pirellulales bacterium]|nr:hypothetical protein [Pirellulales bacterium]
MRRATALVCVCAIVLASRAPAQQPEPNGAPRPDAASADAAPPGERVTHFAVVCTGPAFGERLAKLYEGVNEGMYRVLRRHGYPDEAIYRFAEYQGDKPPRIDGAATVKNLRATFAHLKRIVEPDDRVFVLVVGHGSPGEADYGYALLDGKVAAPEFGDWISALPARNATVVIHPCHGGAFLPRASGPGRVVVTSVNADEVNGVPWAEAFIEAFAKPDQGDADGDGRVSVLEAYRAALAPGRERYGDDLREHPLLDDNGDRIGTFLGNKAAFNGDGPRAAHRFLSPGGRPMTFAPEALTELERANARLTLD